MTTIFMTMQSVYGRIRLEVVSDTYLRIHFFIHFVFLQYVFFVKLYHLYNTQTYKYKLNVYHSSIDLTNLKFKIFCYLKCLIETLGNLKHYK